MTDGDRRITTDDLTEEQIERVLNSRGFQKMLAYQRLADGIDVLEDQDEIFDSMVTSITNQHGSVSTESSVREVLDLFREEVAMFTDPLTDGNGGDGMTGDDLEDVFIDEDDQR